MNTLPPNTDRPLGLSHAVLFLIGVLVLLAVAWAVFHPEIPGIWYGAALKWLLAALVGLFLRGLRRRIFFGRVFSLHQSLSFEIIVQLQHWLSPLLPRRAFESEFLVRETSLPHSLMHAWIQSRTAAIWVMVAMALAGLLWVSEYHRLAWLALGGALILLGVGIHAFRGAIKGVATGVTLGRHLASTLAGLMTWGVEGALFAWAAQDILPLPQALMLYLLFTGLVEFSFLPFALGIAELPALLGLLTDNAPAAFVALLLFHIARLLPFLPLGLLYLSRYKLELADLQNAGIIARLAQSQRPTGGWPEAPVAAERPGVSIVIPAYNEEQRLPAYLTEVRTYLDRGDLQIEVLVVDDGSKDGTAAYVRGIEAVDPRVRLVQQPYNQGKGNAVRRGVLEARGQYVLFTDADGATPIMELDKLLPAVGRNAEIAIGSRRLIAADAERERTGLRELMGRVFYSFVNFLAVPGVRDTQCGFKLFRTDVARELFHDLNESGWAFDVELLYRAQLFGYGIAEVAVNWHEVAGSKINPLRDAIKMFLAIFRIRRRNAGLLRHVPRGLGAQTNHSASHTS